MGKNPQLSLKNNSLAGKKVFLIGLVFIFVSLIWACTSPENQNSQPTTKKMRGDTPTKNSSEASRQAEKTTAPPINPTIEQFYNRLINQFAPELNFSLFPKQSIDYPESLADELEGGIGIPKILEIRNKEDITAGLILYRPNQPFPKTYSLVLPATPATEVISYQITNCNAMPLLKVLQKTNNSTQTLYFDVAQASPGFFPLARKTGKQELSQNQKQQITQRVLRLKRLTQGSLSGANCPPSKNRAIPSISLNMQTSGILNCTQATGFTTNYFFAFQSDTSFVAYALKKYMISPDEQEISQEISPKLLLIQFRLATIKTRQKTPSGSIFIKKGQTGDIPQGWLCK